MLIKKLCVKGRGEGKTKWLIDQALKEMDKGNKEIYYNGSLVGYNMFCRSFERETGQVCKVELLTPQTFNKDINSVYLTDELLTELQYVSNAMESVGGTWYATLGREYTVSE